MCSVCCCVLCILLCVVYVVVCYMWYIFDSRGPSVHSTSVPTLLHRIRKDLVRVVWHLRYGMVWCGVVWYGMVCCGVVWFDFVLFELDWIGLI